MTFRKVFSHKTTSAEHASYVGRDGEITYYDGVFYVHDGVTAGGEAVLASSGGGSGSASWSSITGKPTFATVATSGSYSDLTNTPAIPANLSDLTNDIDAITSTSIGQFGYATQSYVDTAVSGVSGGGGSADTGNITFSGDNMSSTNDEIRMRTQDLTQTGSYNLVAGVDYSTAVWDGGSITFNNDTTQNLYDAIWALTNFSVIQLHVGSDTFTVTTNGSSTPGVPQTATLWVNEIAPNGPLTVDSVDITINTGTETFIEVSGRDVTIDANDDLRMYSNDIFRLVNRSSTDSVEIITDDDNNSYTWEFKSDGVLQIPGDIIDSNGNSVLGGSSGTALPADASGYLNNNGSGTLSWVPGNPSGAGMLPYNDVVVFSNTATSDWTEYTLSGTMDAFYDWNETYTTITLSSQTAYGKEITPNTKTLWINDSKINSNNYIVIDFPSNPSVGDVFTVPMISATETVNAGSFVVGQTYTIVNIGDTNWTAIGAQYNGRGVSFVATGAGSGTGIATAALGAQKVIFKPQPGARAQTMNMGAAAGSLVFGQGGSFDFMYVDLAGQNANNPITWVYAGVIDSIPTWYQFYF